MKQLTDAERLKIALLLLTEHEDIDEFERLRKERELDCERNGFHNTPAECEDEECNECPFNEDGQRQIDCPYVD